MSFPNCTYLKLVFRQLFLEAAESVTMGVANLEQAYHMLESSALSRENTLAVTSAEELMKYESAEVMFSNAHDRVNEGLHRCYCVENPQRILQLCIRHNFCYILVSRHASKKSFLNFARKMSSFLSLEANVYWIRNNGFDNLSYWESYSTKAVSFVQQLPINDEDNLFNHLVTTRYSRRSDFHGAPITATAAVLYCNIISRL